MGEAEAQKALRKLVDILEGENVPYAIIGALALNEYGHRRVTVDVDLIMREEDLQEFKRRWLGRGYAERVPGTGKLLDKPKPVAFPDPATTAVRGGPFAMLPVERWIELKLASGMVAAHRLKDLADVQELIRIAKMPAAMAESLHPWVREKFLELWQSVQAGEASDPY